MCDGGVKMYFKEDRYPLASDGKPDLSYFTDTLEYYVEMYETFARSINRKLDISEAEKEFNRRCHAVSGLIAHGAAAIPYALKMLSNGESEVRQDGADVLEELGQRRHVVEHLVTALVNETNAEALSTLIAALGRLRARQVLPALARILSSREDDRELQWNAAEAVGRIVRRSFMRRPDPVKAALEWLEKQPV
jgi:HEAT repeats